MAEHRDRTHQQVQVHAHTGGVTYPGQKDVVGLGPHGNPTAGSGPSGSQVVAVVALLPVAGTLLALAGITLVGTLVGLAVALPLMVIFSPVLVPAAFLAGLAVMAFLASGALGVTGMSSLSWVVGYLREAAQRQLPEQVDNTKRRMADVAAFVGQKTKETGQTIQHKAQESGGRT